MGGGGNEERDGRKRKKIVSSLSTSYTFVKAAMEGRKARRLTQLPRTRTDPEADGSLESEMETDAETESSRVRTVESLFGGHPGELGG